MSTDKSKGFINLNDKEKAELANALRSPLIKGARVSLLDGTMVDLDEADVLALRKWGRERLNTLLKLSKEKTWLTPEDYLSGSEELKK